MSVLIKGMKMPENGNETIIRIQPNGTILDQYGHHLIIKAVHIQSHGRLIDADKMRESIMKQSALTRLIGGEEFAEMAEILEKGFLQEINNAPTIIPAEEGRSNGRIYY